MDEKKYLTPYAAGMSLLKNKGEIGIYMDKIRALPDQLQQVMTSSDTADYLEGLDSKFGLSEQQIEALTFVLKDYLLDNSTGDLSERIQTGLNISPDQSQKIKNDLVSTLMQKSPEKNSNPSKPSSVANTIRYNGITIPRANLIDLRNKNHIE